MHRGEARSRAGISGWIRRGLLAACAVGTLGARPARATDPVLTGGVRLQSSAGYDNNVLEELETRNRVDDAFLRLQAEARMISRRLPFHARGELVGRALSESYDRRPGEDRRQGEISGSIGLADPRAQRRLLLEGGIRGRDYPDSALRNHWRAWGRALSALPFGPRGTLVGRFDLWSLDFRRTPRRDRTGGSFDLTYEHPTAARLVLSGGLELGTTRHGVHSIQLERDDTTGEPSLDPEGPDREDHLRLFHVGVRRIGRVLLRAQYGFRGQSSNSIDGEYRRHEISWLLSGALSWGVHAQFYGNRGYTTYTSRALDDNIVTRVGEIEAGEDDNTIALRLTRSIGRGWSADLRAGWFRNESLIVGDYYEKTVLTAGLSWEAGNASGF